MNILLLMMAGSGVRFGAKIPKQFVEVKGRPIFSYILEGYHEMPEIDAIAIVTHPDWFDHVREWNDKVGGNKLLDLIPGGATRSESVKNGLNGISSIASPDDVVMIHDATHPYVDKDGVVKIIEAVKTHGGATLGQFQYDTVYQMDDETHFIEKVVPRQKIVSGASPEAFRFKDIHDIYMNSTEEELAAMTSAGAIALAHDIPMKVIRTDLINLKITYSEDMKLFCELVDYYFPDAKKQ